MKIKFQWSDLKGQMKFMSKEENKNQIRNRKQEE